MRIEKRIGAALTASALAFGLIATPLERVPLSFGTTVSAQEQLVSAYISADMSSLPDSSELEEAYINKLFYGGGFSFYKDYGRDQLSGTQLEVYNALRSKIEAVANGSAESTVFTLTRKISVKTSEEAQAELGKFGEEIEAAVQYLLVDLPADFYWYDKTSTGGMNASGGYNGYLNDLELKFDVMFTVSQDYMDGNNTTVNSSKITAAQNAAKNAKTIADYYADKSEYEKVLAFRDEICAFTDYNFDALKNKPPYGDPWQLVHVFDGDPETKVVCEGYSKAFQYLCDLSGIECYTVSGKSKAGNGAGDHMWNIVVLDGKSYLVDITNSDSGSIGQEGELLLKGAAESDGSGCTFTSTNPDMIYEYDPETIALYSSAGILTVSKENYDPNASGELTGEVSIEISPKAQSVAVGETCDVKVLVTATGDLVDVEGELTWEYDENIISVGQPSKDGDYSVFTVEGLAEGSTDLTIGWKPTEGSGVTLEDGEIADTCKITVTAAECDHEWDESEWESDETGHWHLCTKCDTGKSDVVKHTETAGDNRVEADCTTEGREADTVCSVCDYIIKKGEVIPAKGHTPGEPKQENIKDASCTVAGSYEEAVYCKDCGEEISRKTVTGKTLPHDMAEVPGTAKAPTCVDKGKEADKKCKNCVYTEEGEVIDATGKHTMVEDPASAEEATCAEAGKEADKECSVCGLKETGKEIPATGKHTAGAPKRINEVAATCYREGSYDEVTECTVCRKELSKEHKTIDKLDHTPGEPTKENETPATCIKDGSYDMVTKCTVEECGEVIKTEHFNVPAPGHSFGAMVPGETSHYQECSVCATKVGEAAHTKDSGTVTTAPTEDTDGVRTYSCTVCKKVLDTEVIPALGEGHAHSYTIKNSDASSHWNECVCGAKDAVVPHTPDTKEEIALGAVCNVDGLKYVITYCTDCGSEISRDSTAIPKTGVHTAGADYENDSTDHWNTCVNCGTVMNKAPHEAGPAATETTPQTCTECGYEMAPVIAHTHTFASEWTHDDNFHWLAATCQHSNEISGKAVHVWDGGVITTQPTETSKGVKTFTCVICKATKTESVSEIAHTHTPSDAWKFDVTGHWHACGSCDEKLNFAAHNEVSEVTVAPAATVTGTRRYYCSICRYVIREETIPATGVVDPVYPSYPAGSTIVFPPTSNTKDPILDGGSGKSGWKNIADDIRNASSGEAVYVNMNGTTTLSKTALRELMGKNVDLVLEMGEITWTVNGETVTKATDVNMKAKLNTNNIPNKIIEALSENGDVVQVSLSHSGSFGFDAVMTVYLGTRYNGKYANLMYYDSKSGAAEYIDCSLIIDGKADLDFTHASEYAIVISDKPMGEYEDVSAASEASESGVSASPAVYVSVLAVIAAAMVIFRKKAVK